MQKFAQSIDDTITQGVNNKTVKQAEVNEINILINLTKNHCEQNI